LDWYSEILKNIYCRDDPATQKKVEAIREDIGRFQSEWPESEVVANLDEMKERHADIHRRIEDLAPPFSRKSLTKV